MPVPAFVQQHLARPSLLVGAVVALTGGLSVGSYLRAGEMFADRPAPQVVVALAATPEPVRYMTGADGRIPDYVLGTDHTYRPSEVPTIRAAWETPSAPEDPADRFTMPVAPVQPPEPVVYTPPPSLGGDILAVDTTSPPAPVG